MSRNETVEQRALEQYRALCGKMVRTKHLIGLETGDLSEDVDGDFIVRIEETLSGDVLQWQDDWLDPIYNVTVLSLSTGVPPPRCWIWGESHHEDGQQTQPGDVVEILNGAVTN